MAQKRYEISDEQWNQIKDKFPIAKTGRPPIDNRIIFNAILWIARSGAAWRDLPERFGSWKTVYSRFCKWRDDGTLLALFNELNSEADYENLSIDSTCIKAHQHSAGAKKGYKSRNKTAYWIKPRCTYNKNPCGCRWYW